jgi:ABC-type Na+ efflux pump permease subunit
MALAEEARLDQETPGPGAQVPSTAHVAAQQQVFAHLPVGFSNPIALRVAFLMSLGIMLVQMVPGLSLLFVIWWVAAGWGGVLLYRRMTGMTLSAGSGAKLGTLTGIITFVGMAIVFSMTMLFAGKQVLEDMVKQQPEMSQIANDPPMLAAVFLMVLAIIFVMVVGFCAAGGALGARLMTPRSDA